MKPIQLILIGVALLAALGAGFLMMNLNSQPDQQAVVIQKSKPEPQDMVLIAKSAIPMGTALSEENLSWEAWPKKNIREAYVIKSAKPEAMKEYVKAIARSSFFEGEPIRQEKIVNTDSGYLSAILPAGKRAMALRVNPETSVAGFVLPNDHVDVIMTYREEKLLLTETILQNIRVLAIDQVIEEQDGEKAIVGSTVTLELTAQQIEIIVAAKSISNNKLSLALRSVEDSELASSSAGEHLLSSGTRKNRGTVRVIKYGNTQEVRPKK